MLDRLAVCYVLTGGCELDTDAGAATSEVCWRVPPSSRIFIDCRTPKTFLANCCHRYTETSDHHTHHTAWQSKKRN